MTFFLNYVVSRDEIQICLPLLLEKFLSSERTNIVLVLPAAWKERILGKKNVSKQDCLAQKE